MENFIKNYSENRLRHINNINDEVVNITDEQFKHNAIEWLEREIFVLALSDLYDITDDFRSSIRNNWSEADFDSRNITIDEETGFLNHGPIPRGFIISNNSINDKLFSRINQTTLIGYNKSDCLNNEPLNQFYLDRVNCSILLHNLLNHQDVVINEVIEQLNTAVNNFYRYMEITQNIINDENKTVNQRIDEVRHLLCVFEEDSNLEIQHQF